MSVYSEHYQTEKPLRIGRTLNVAAERCAFITLPVVSLLVCVVNPLLTQRYLPSSCKFKSTFSVFFSLTLQALHPSALPSALSAPFCQERKCHVDTGLKKSLEGRQEEGEEVQE